MSRKESFKKRLDSHGAEWMEWRDRQVVGDFGDPDTEYHSVRDENGRGGIVDHSYHDTLVVSGPDSVEWLQGLVTSNLIELADEGAGQLTTVVNQVGRLIAEARVLHIPGMLVLDLEPGVLAASLLPHLRRHVITEDVELIDRSTQTARISVYGELVGQLIDGLCQTHRPVGALDEFDGTWGTMGDEDVIIQRVPLVGEEGFDLSCSSEAAIRVWNSLYSAGQPVVPVGFETLESLRIEAGIPRFGKELTEQRIPLECGLEHAISFNKGCYLGQEIIARLDTRGTPARLLRTLVLEAGAAPREGAEVECDGTVVGQVETSTWSPTLEKPIALAYIKRNFNDLGTQVEVEARTARVEALGYALAQANSDI